MKPVIDLHCDMMMYLGTKESRGYDDPDLPCSLAKMKKGGVVFQAFPLFALTAEHSEKEGLAQLRAFDRLLEKSVDFSLLRSETPNEDLLSSDRIHFLLAIENLSSLCGEDCKLSELEKNLAEIRKRDSNTLYCSLTWMEENRFGGGDKTDIGLKPDGKIAVELLAEAGIALDFTHTCFRLADELMNEISKLANPPRVLSSHSVFHEVEAQDRNLKTEICKEIVQRGGVLGINAIPRFVGGTDSSALFKHIEFAEQQGFAEALVMGADYYYVQDAFPDRDPKSCYLEGLHDSSCYQDFFDRMSSHGFSDERIDSLSSKSAESYLKKFLES